MYKILGQLVLYFKIIVIVYHFKAISFKKNDVESASITNHKKKEL